MDLGNFLRNLSKTSMSSHLCCGKSLGAPANKEKISWSPWSGDFENLQGPTTFKDVVMENCSRFPWVASSSSTSRYDSPGKSISSSLGLLKAQVPFSSFTGKTVECQNLKMKQNKLQMSQCSCSPSETSTLSQVVQKNCCLTDFQKNGKGVYSLGLPVYNRLPITCYMNGNLQGNPVVIPVFNKTHSMFGSFQAACLTSKNLSNSSSCFDYLKNRLACKESGNQTLTCGRKHSPVGKCKEKGLKRPYTQCAEMPTSETMMNKTHDLTDSLASLDISSDCRGSTSTVFHIGSPPTEKPVLPVLQEPSAIDSVIRRVKQSSRSKKELHRQRHTANPVTVCSGVTSEQDILEELFGQNNCKSDEKKCEITTTREKQHSIDSQQSNADHTRISDCQHPKHEGKHQGDRFKAHIFLTPKANPVVEHGTRLRKKCRPSSEKRRRLRLKRYEQCSSDKEPGRKGLFKKRMKLEPNTSSPTTCARQGTSALSSESDAYSFVIGFQSSERDNQKSMSKPVPSATSSNFSVFLSAADLSEDSSEEDDSDFYEDAMDCSSTLVGEQHACQDLDTLPFMTGLVPFTVQITCFTQKDKAKEAEGLNSTDAEDRVNLSTGSQSDLQEMNLKWNSVYSTVDPKPCRKSSVQFEEEPGLATIHCLTEWPEEYQDSRKGPWEQYGRDRERFHHRISEVDRAISHCLVSDHRNRIYQHIYGGGVH